MEIDFFVSFTLYINMCFLVFENILATPFFYSFNRLIFKGVD